MEEPFNKDLDSAEISFEREAYDSLQFLSINCADPVKLFSVSQLDLLAASNNYICTALDRNLTIYKVDIQEPKTFTFTSTIKIIEINKISNLLAIQLENFGFIIFNLDAEKEIFEYSQSQTIQIMR